MAFIPASNSVVAFQSNPSVLQTLTGLMSTNASVITVGGAGVANQSVSGTIHVDNFSSVVAFQQAGSILAVSGSFTPAANQSVSGTVQVDVRGSVATVIIGGSIAASFTPPANQSVSGAVSVSNFPTTQNVSGSVVATQGTTPWQVVSSLAGGIFPISGSVAATVTNFPAVQVVAPNNSSLFSLQPAGSILAVSGSFTAPANQSVSGTVQVDVRGSVAAVIIGGSIATTTGNSSVQVLNFPTNQSVSGTVGTTQVGTWITSMVSTVPSSVLVGASIFGQLPAGTAMIGSVAVLQGTALWNISGSVASRIATSTNSSVLVFWPAPSIVGTYLEDAAHTSGDRGLFVMGVRNDTVASFMGANGEYGPFGIDSAGRTVNKPFAPGEASLIASTSIVSTGNTASVQLFPAPGAGLRNYITDFNVSNTGAATTLVAFNDADASVFAKTIAPAGGGSNFQYATPVTGPTANKITTVQIFTASSVVHLTVTGFKAP